MDQNGRKDVTTIADGEWKSIVVGGRLDGAQFIVSKEGTIGLCLETDCCCLTVAQCEELAEWATKAAAEARKRGGQ